MSKITDFQIIKKLGKSPSYSLLTLLLFNPTFSS